MSYEILTTNEAARLLGVSRPLVIQWIDSGALKGFRIPGSPVRRVPRDALVEFAQRHGMPLVADLSSQRLLIVDDDRAFAEALKAGLRRSSKRWEIHLATTGFEAGKVIAEIRPHAVLLDIRLPDIDGRQIGRSIRQDPLLGGVILIGTSGYLTEAEERKLLAQGFDGYLRKPFTVHALLSRIQALQGAHAAQTLDAR